MLTRVDVLTQLTTFGGRSFFPRRDLLPPQLARERTNEHQGPRIVTLVPRRTRESALVK